MVGESEYTDEDDYENDHYHREKMIKMMPMTGTYREIPGTC